MATDIDLINAALTRTGNETITSLDDGTAAAAAASANYGLLVEKELSGYRWRWASSETRLSRLDGDVYLPWTAAYQLPSDLLLIRTVKVDGEPIAYERKFDKILCGAGEDDEVVLHHTWKVPEAYWPGFFAEVVIRRLEAIFLRALGERYEEAKARDEAADEQRDEARLLDAQGQPPVNPHVSKILEARGGGSAN